MVNEDYQITFCSFYRKGFVKDLDLKIEIEGNNGVLTEYDAITDLLNIKLRGPEKILGITPNMMARVYPPANSNDEEPNYFAYVDFVDPDFPWRFTPSSFFPETIDINTRIDSWLSLVVLSTDEIKQMETNDLTVIERKNGKEVLNINLDFLPPSSLTWSAAHVQLTGFSGLPDEIDSWIQENPEKTFSRLVCFKRLKPKTSYHAFLVPKFKKSLIPHQLTSDPIGTVGDSNAWDSGDPDQTTPISLPIYYKWRFMTAEKGDFEELVRNLTPWIPDPDKIGKTLIDSSVKKKDQDLEKHYFKREGALGVIGEVDSEQETIDHPLKGMLFDHMDESLKFKNTSVDLDDIILDTGDEDEDPLVTFPVYGRYFRQTDAIINDESLWAGDSNPWIHKANLLLKNRVVCGFGTKVVQINQDKYAEECWRQVGDIRLANERLRLTNASFRLNERLFKKHLNTNGSDAKISKEHFAFLSTPFQSLFSVQSEDEEISGKRALERTGISKGVFSPSFRKIGYRHIGLNHMYNEEELWEPINRANLLATMYFENLRKTDTEIPSKMSISNIVDALKEQKGLEERKIISRIEEDFWEFVSVLKVNVDFTLGGIINTYSMMERKPEIIPVSRLDNNYFHNFEPSNLKETVKKKLGRIIVFNNAREIPENFESIMVSPKIDDPMYKPLSKLSHDYIIPGIGNIQNNVTFLLEENRKFIETNMMSDNHEMGRELVWREFPTDQRGTIFSYFWDSTTLEVDEVTGELILDDDGQPIKPTDIDKIHTWGRELGSNKSNSIGEPVNSGNIVLVIKGDLVRRYPDMIIYAFNVVLEEGQQYLSKAAVNGLNFDDVINPIFKAQLGTDILCMGFPISKVDLNSPDSNYYFVLQEQQDLPVFGADITCEVGGTDLCWGDMTISEENRYVTDFPALNFTPPGGGGVTSSSIANRTYQVPVRIFLHASLMFNKDLL
jgi:hypothetical protein